MDTNFSIGLRVIGLAGLLIGFSGISSAENTDNPAFPPVATFSIVAVDPETGEIGVAVQSRIVGVGAVVPWARAGIGAVATQGWANVRYGPVGLAILELGSTSAQAIEMLTRADPEKGSRQVGIVDAAGNAATFTGDDCEAWAGGREGEGYAVQGNLLAGREVVDAMAEAFENSSGDLLAERLLAALEAGQAAGGDRRGKQSAALLVVRRGWGYGGGNDRFRDVRVDEHEHPIAELRRVYEKHRDLFPRPDGRRPKADEQPGAGRKQERDERDGSR